MGDNNNQEPRDFSDHGQPGQPGQPGHAGVAGQGGQGGRGGEGTRGEVGEQGEQGEAGATLDPETLQVLAGLADALTEQKEVVKDVNKLARKNKQNRIVIGFLCLAFITQGLLFWNQVTSDTRQVDAICEVFDEVRQFNREVYLVEAETAEAVVARDEKAAANPPDLTAVPGYDGLDRASKKFLAAITVANAAEAKMLLRDNVLEAERDRRTYETYVRQFPLPCG